MNELKKLIILLFVFILGVIGGFLLCQELSRPTAEKPVVPMDEQDDDNDSVIDVKNFAELPSELPENWTDVKITKKLPAVVLICDDENSDLERQRLTDNYNLTSFSDKNYDYYVTFPMVDREIGEKCVRNGYGIIATSIHDKETSQRLDTQIIFYDQDEVLTLTLHNGDIITNRYEPFFDYSGAGFASIEEDCLSDKVWCQGINYVTPADGSDFVFSPYTMQINGEAKDSSVRTALKLIDSYSVYRDAMEYQIWEYGQVDGYFNHNAQKYADFDLAGCVVDHFGGKISTSYEQNYDESTDMLWSCHEVMNIQTDSLDIGIIYTYNFGNAMYPELCVVTVNGEELTYEKAKENNQLFRSEDFSSRVKIGREATMNRIYFNYILSLLLETHNK